MPDALDAAALTTRLEALVTACGAGTPGESATPGAAVTPRAVATPATAACGVALVAGGGEWTVQIPAGLFATPAAAAQGVAISIPSVRQR